MLVNSGIKTLLITGGPGCRASIFHFLQELFRKRRAIGSWAFDLFSFHPGGSTERLSKRISIDSTHPKNNKREIMDKKCGEKTWRS